MTASDLLARIVDGSTATAVASCVHPGLPVPKARARVATSRRGKRHGYTPKRTEEAEGALAVSLLAARCGAGLRVLSGRVALAVVVRFRRAARGDWDNYGKLVSDAGNKVAWADDRQIKRAVVVVEDGAGRDETEVAWCGLDTPDTAPPGARRPR